MLKSIRPKLSRVVVLTNPGNVSHPNIVEVIMKAGVKAGVSIVQVAASTVDEIERSFLAMKAERADF